MIVEKSVDFVTRLLVLICIISTATVSYGFNKSSSKLKYRLSDLSKLKVKRMMTRSVRWGKRSNDLVDEVPWKWIKTKSSRPFRMGKRKNSFVVLKKSRPLRMGK